MTLTFDPSKMEGRTRTSKGGGIKAGFTKLTRKGNSYADIDSIPEELIKVEFEKDKRLATR